VTTFAALESNSVTELVLFLIPCLVLKLREENKLTNSQVMVTAGANQV